MSASISALSDALNDLPEAVILSFYHSVSDSLWSCSSFAVRNALTVVGVIFGLFLDLFGRSLRLVSASGTVMSAVEL